MNIPEGDEIVIYKKNNLGQIEVTGYTQGNGTAGASYYYFITKYANSEVYFRVIKHSHNFFMPSLEPDSEGYIFWDYYFGYYCSFEFFGVYWVKSVIY